MTINFICSKRKGTAVREDGLRETRLSGETWNDFEVDGIDYSVLGTVSPEVIYGPGQEPEEGIEEALIAYIKGW